MGDLELVANISLLFAELPYLDRFRAARDAGFQSVETWWPFATAVPCDDELEAFLEAADDIPLSGMNLFAGDTDAGERGLVSRPDRAGEFEANLQAVANIAQRTGCRVFNALYGQRIPGSTPTAQDALAVKNLQQATRTLGAVGGTVLVEVQTRGMSGAYPLERAQQVATLVTRVRRATDSAAIGMLFDTFHLANNGDDLLEVIERFAPLISHVQLADSPGRGEPGSGGLPMAEVVERLWVTGYRGAVACEYIPTSSTLNSLGWLEGFPRLALHPWR